LDLLTKIEEQLALIMKDIKTTTTLPSGYIYYNDVTITNIEDECVATSAGNFPTVSVYQKPNENILSGTQHAYENEVFFELVGSVSLDDPVDTPRFAINKKMNELLSDIKAVLSNNNSLNCSCELVEVLNSTRKYNNDGDEFRAGDLIVNLRVSYTQSRLNPNTRCVV